MFQGREACHAISPFSPRDADAIDARRRNGAYDLTRPLRPRRLPAPDRLMARIVLGQTGCVKPLGRSAPRLGPLLFDELVVIQKRGTRAEFIMGLRRLTAATS